MSVPRWKTISIDLTDKVPVDASSNIESFGYSLSQRVLAVKFREDDKKGKPYLYHYNRISEDIYADLHKLAKKHDVNDYFIKNVKDVRNTDGKTYYRKPVKST